jgi:uncharacterized protein (TIGR00369 family)
MALLGASLQRVEAGAVDIVLPFRSDLTQQNGFLHAAVTTAIADNASGFAALSMIPADSEVLTIEYKVNFLRPAAGEKFVAEGRILKPGKTISVARADVFAHSQSSMSLVATMLATVIRRDGPK